MSIVVDGIFVGRITIILVLFGKEKNYGGIFRATDGRRYKWRHFQSCFAGG